MDFIKRYLQEEKTIIDLIDLRSLEKIINIVSEVKNAGGRLFFIGVGGGAGHASHAVNDFRKICGIESYTPADNVSEITARTNDEGWDTVFAGWLKGSRLSNKDVVFVFSVGGGNREENISVNIVKSLEYAQQVGARICGIVGRDGGYTAKVADACVIIPTVNKETLTPHTEGLQAVLWHLIVSHPRLLQFRNKWESVTSNK